MKRMLALLILIFIGLHLSSCNYEQQRKELEQREADLFEREQKLLIRENLLTQVEDSLKLILSKSDSLASRLASASLPVPDSLQGMWNVAMMCTQTSCSGFAVGDTRKENWSFENNDSTGVLVRALQGEKLIRVYTGIYDGSGFILSTPYNSEASTTVMNVYLTLDINSNKLTGSRTINQADGCTTTFKLDAERPKR
jgi:hypothetical protein